MRRRLVKGAVMSLAVAGLVFAPAAAQAARGLYSWQGVTTPTTTSSSVASRFMTARATVAM